MHFVLHCESMASLICVQFDFFFSDATHLGLSTNCLRQTGGSDGGGSEGRASDRWVPPVRTNEKRTETVLALILGREY
jgi:hypothetical protein